MLKSLSFMKTTAAEDYSYELSLQLWKVVPIIVTTSLVEWALYLIYQSYFHSWSPILAPQPPQEVMDQLEEDLTAPAENASNQVS